MHPQPFLQDPSDLLRDHVSKAIASPLRDVAAIHIDLALQQADLAHASRLLLRLTKDLPA
jgi:hypothetical protein